LSRVVLRYGSGATEPLLYETNDRLTVDRFFFEQLFGNEIEATTMLEQHLAGAAFLFAQDP